MYRAGTETRHRMACDLYPDYTSELEEIERNGITPELLKRIIDRHAGNASYMRGLYDRYQVLDGALPIFNRIPRFSSGDSDDINNHLNNDYFGEIIDFKTGYFAGKEIAYNYSNSAESQTDTGGEQAVKVAKKLLSDFVTRNNMYDIDMETTKVASICGYCGRLLYIDPDGEPRVMVTMPFQTILLYRNEMTEPKYGVRYYWVLDCNDHATLKVEFYDEKYLYHFEGQSGAHLTFIKVEEHFLKGCPLIGIPNNEELMGDAEKVLSLIDDYDKITSDNSNELESFAHAYMEFRGVPIEDKDLIKAKQAGSFIYQPTADTAGINFITKEANDTYNEHHLERLQKDIYKFSKTPNLSDESFGTASGISLKFKLIGLETKCGMFQAKMQSAGVTMFRLLAGVWQEKNLKEFDPLQCFMSFKRNFPLDLLGDAQAAQALLGAGVPKQTVFENLPCIDDVDYVMQLLEDEKDGISSLTDDIPEDEDEETNRWNHGQGN